MDSSTCEEMYVQLRAGLVSRAWMILGNREAAEDSVQNCFCKLLAYDLREIDNPAAYLQSMVAHACFREIRYRRRTSPVADIPDSITSDPEYSDTISLLRELTARRRMALVLRYCYDYSVEDIAGIMSCRPSTVSSLLRRAIHQLRESPHARAIAFS
jgi:RNA polymerase sigma factor (sigma-70 family)